MNLVLSCIAALQAPIIMMSQNRQEEKERERGENEIWSISKRNLKFVVYIRSWMYCWRSRSRYYMNRKNYK